MKTTNQLFILIATVLLSFSITSCKDSKEHIVTLYVNTDSISKDSINKYSNFGQNKDSISNEEYTIIVNVGDKITWIGVSSDSPSTDVVNITSINHVGGKNIFDKNILKGNGGDPEHVVGKALYSTIDEKDNKKHDKYKYKIFFTVTNNGVQRNGTFHIDPKIQVN